MVHRRITVFYKTFLHPSLASRPSPSTQPGIFFLHRRSKFRVRWPRNLGFEENSSSRGGLSSTLSSTAYISSSLDMAGTRRCAVIYHTHPPGLTKKKYADARLVELNTLKYSVWISRGAGLVLAFDGGLILIPMLRNILCFLRSGLRWLLPADENVWFHRQVAYSMAFWTMVHTTAHYVNFINVERSRAFFIYLRTLAFASL